MAALQSAAEGCPPPRSFANVVAVGNSHPPVPSTMKEGGLYKGEPALYYTLEEISTLSTPLQRALIGKFSRGRPSMDHLRKEFHTIGFKEPFSLGLIDHRHVLIRFDLDEDYHRCWLRASWNFGRFSMRVLKWTPSFTIEEEPPVAPVWISLEFLPLYLFGKGPLYSIASLIGKPLKMDTPTQTLARPSVARVCVEVDLTKPLPKRIWIRIEATGFWQPVSYENLPSYCHTCRKLGHAQLNCKLEKDPAGPKMIWKAKPLKENILGVSPPLQQSSVPAPLPLNLENNNTRGTQPLQHSIVPAPPQQNLEDVIALDQSEKEEVALMLQQPSSSGLSVRDKEIIPIIHHIREPSPIPVPTALAIPALTAPAIPALTAPAIPAMPIFPVVTWPDYSDQINSAFKDDMAVKQSGCEDVETLHFHSDSEMDQVDEEPRRQKLEAFRLFSSRMDKLLPPSTLEAGKLSSKQPRRRYQRRNYFNQPKTVVTRSQLARSLSFVYK